MPVNKQEKLPFVDIVQLFIYLSEISINDF